MRLIECYIENFGMYREYSTKFDTGLNCRLSENGSGKTTLTAFIAAMLYGMPETRKQSLSENERKKYMPWQGGAYGGSLTLEASGKRYTVERLFGSKPSDDTFTLRDTVRGAVSTDYSERIGEELFGIDRDGFLRTVFLSEKSLSITNENKSISAKLSDLVGVDGDVGGFDDAIALLDERRKFYYKKSGKCEINNTRALLAEKRAELDGINERLLGSADRAAELDRLSERRKLLEEEKRVLGDELIKSTEENKKRLNLERYRELEDKYESLEKRKSELSEIFGGSVPTQTKIDEMRFALMESERIEREESIGENAEFKDERYAALSFEAIASTERAAAELLSLDKEAERLLSEREIQRQRKPKKKKPKTPAILTAAFGAVLTVLGIILGIGIPVLFLLAALGALLFTVGIVMSVSGNTENGEASALTDLDERLARTSEKAEKLRGMLKEFLHEFGKKSEDISNSLGEIKEEFTRYYTERLSRASDKEGREVRLASARSQRARVAEFLAQYKIEGEDPLLQLSKLVTEWEYTKAECERAKLEYLRFAELNELGKENSTAPVKDGTVIGMEISRRDEELTLGRELFARLTRQCELDLADRERRDELSSEIAILEEKLEEYVKTLEVIQGTMQYLEEACNNMTSRYIGKTEESFKKYESALGGAGGSFAVGTDFSVTKNEHGAARSEESYSRGTRDLLALSIRLALIDSLYENERPFIILDDPFIALDDERVKDGAKLLSELAKDRQILYFTCSKSREI